MKVNVSCMKCSFENTAYTQFEKPISINESNLYHYKCMKGHNNLLEIQAFKFELLFESGLFAIKDKYFLESVLSLTASMERFYEFFVKLIMKTSKIENSLSDKIFNLIARQSERQLGAFIGIYSLKYKEEPPKMLRSKSIEFRNKVVHKGYLPSEKEVLNYAKEVFELIKYYYIKIREEHDDEIRDYLTLIQIERREKNKKLIDSLDTNITVMAPAFALTHVLHLDLFKDKDFDSSYESVKKARNIPSI